MIQLKVQLWQCWGINVVYVLVTSLMLQWKKDNIDNIFSLQNQNVKSRNTTWNSENTMPSSKKHKTKLHQSFSQQNIK